MKNLEVLEEIKKQGKNLIGTKRDEFVKQNLLSDEFIEMMQKNKKPFDLLMSYYQCAIMEIRNTRFPMTRTRSKESKQGSNRMRALCGKSA